MPGRVNLIGEHIDYHNLAVLPMAIQRRVSLEYTAREDDFLRARSDDYGARELRVTERAQMGEAGDWANYIRAAVEAAKQRWRLTQGIDATVHSDLPPAAGLSSSSALLTGFVLALLRANGFSPTVAELMEVLPEGEQFVGTRGGGMDHAAVLAAKRGCALLIEFAPFAATNVPIPDSWGFIVAHSLKTAEKSGAVREEYNSRRTAAMSALAELGFSTYREALERHTAEELLHMKYRPEFRHVVSEAGRVRQAVSAMQRNDKAEFGRLLSESHKSLRDDLRVSCADLDELVDEAMRVGALGARLTGAGFGGCAIIFAEKEKRVQVAEKLKAGFYAKRKGFEEAKHLMLAEPSAGALGE